MQVILAPHHDDALLSLPGLLLDADRPRPALVVVFSDVCPALERTCDGLHRALGLVPICLGLPEARRRGLSLRAILRARRPRPEGDPLVEAVAERVAESLAGLGASALLAPATLTHLDHALVRLAAERVCVRLGLGLQLYEDQPYAGLRRGTPMGGGRVSCPRPSPAALHDLLDPLRPFLATRDIDRLQMHLAPAVSTVAT